MIKIRTQKVFGNGRESMKKKRRFGDRTDGYLVRDNDPMHILFPHLLPNRTDNEVSLCEEVDLCSIREYLDKKNADSPEFRYTIFHVVLAALARVMAERPHMNRFYAGDRLYQRNYISFAFVIKQDYSDDSPETIAIIKYDPELEASPISQVYDSIRDAVNTVRKDGNVEDDATGAMKIVGKLPRFLMKFVVWILKTLDYYGKYPKSLMEVDPYYSTCFVSNLGSIRLHADYHHLVNRGTNSIFLIIGQKKETVYIDRNGNAAKKDMLPLAITIDERIADGVYFSKSLSKLRKYLLHPEVLDESLATKECSEKESENILSRELEQGLNKAC